MPVPVVVNRLKFVNSWLVREDDGLTLIDANIPGTAGRIIAKAQQLGAPITRIVLTHAHPDHVGSLDKLHEQLPHAEVLISERDARPLNGDGSLDPHEPKGRKLQALKIKTRPTGHLVAGERVGSLGSAVVAMRKYVEKTSPQYRVLSRVSRSATWPGVWPGDGTTSRLPTRSPATR